jgi:hypothetical protein
VNRTVFAFSGSGTTALEPIMKTMPSLTVRESAGAVCLELGGFARGTGASLQEAADDLVQSVLSVVMAFRSSGFTPCKEICPDLETLDFLAELGEFAAAGGDIRELVFG